MNYEKIKLLNRVSINNILENIFHYKLIYISATGGYGKTTAVKNFFKVCSYVDVLWFCVSECGQAKTDVYSDFLNQLGSFLNISIDINDNIADKVGKSISSTTVLVIDDYYLNNSEELKCALYELCRASMRNLSIIILDRYMPDIEIQLNQNYIILNQSVFEFSKNEIKELFIINGIELSEKEISDIYNYSEGWALSIYLILENKVRRNNFNFLLNIQSFCKELVYYEICQEDKLIIMSLSFIDSFDIEQAEYITKNKNVGMLIKYLCHHQCFITFNETNKKYRMHNILREAIKEDAKANNISKNEIYILNAQWYCSIGEFVNAIKNYYLAGDYESIYAVSENDIFVNDINMFSELVDDILNNMSDDIKIKYPLSYLKYIYYYISHINAYEGKLLLDKAKEFFEENMSDNSFLFAEISLIDSFNQLKNIDRFSSSILNAEKLFGDKRSKIINGKIEFNFGVPCVLYLYHRRKGHMKELVEKLKNTFQIFRTLSNNCDSGIDEILYGEYCIETGDYSEAVRQVNKAIYKATFEEQKNIIVEAKALKIRIELLAGNIKNASKIADDIQKIKQKCLNKSLIRQIDMTIGYYGGIIGNIDVIPDWIKNYSVEDTVNKFESSQACFIMYGLAMVLKKDFDMLEAHSELMEEHFSDNGNIYRLIYSLIFNVISNINYKKYENAKNMLIKALEYCECDNIRLPLIELSPHYISLLKDISKYNPFAETILYECINYTNFYKKFNRIKNENSFDLSIRESQIMNMLVENKKQKDIAGELSITLPTVKTHIKNIYNKLGVDNKYDAIDKWLEGV